MIKVNQYKNEMKPQRYPKSIPNLLLESKLLCQIVINVYKHLFSVLCFLQINNKQSMGQL